METPCSIPNQEAKHIVGDDTTPYWRGKVAHCGLVNSYMIPKHFIKIEKFKLNQNSKIDRKALHELI